MFRIVFAGLVAVMVGAMLGWIGAFWSVAQNAYQTLYGKPMPHAQGNTLDHINDWLAFLPSDPATRAAIVAGFIVGLLTLVFVINVVGMRYGKHQQAQQIKAGARARTMSSYNKVR